MILNGQDEFLFVLSEIRDTPVSYAADQIGIKFILGQGVFTFFPHGNECFLNYILAGFGVWNISIGYTA
jgi:hypothetical protein